MPKHKDNGVAVLESPSTGVDEYVGALPEAESTGPALAIETLEAVADIGDQVADLDDLPPVSEAAPEPPAVPTLEGALEAVSTFDAMFAGLDVKSAEPLYNYASSLQECTDDSGKAQEYVNIAQLALNFMIAEFNRLGANYKRARAIEMLDDAAAVLGVPQGYPARLFVQVAWLVKLDRSVPGEKKGDPRSFADEGAVPDDWFGGNLTFDTLRKLSPMIRRVSALGKNGDGDELDVWEYVEHMEAKVRAVIKSLRAGTYSQGQAMAFVKFHADVLKREAVAKAEAGLDDNQKRDRLALKLQKEEDAKYTKLRNMFRDAMEFGQKELHTSREYVRDTLLGMGIIPPLPDLTMKGFALLMTPGDAKELVQILAGNSKHEAVLKSLNREMVNIVNSRAQQADGTKLKAKSA